MANVCDLQSGNSSTPVGTYVECNNMESSVTNVSRNKKTSFKIPVTLWVRSKKVQTEALVDSGATANFIDKSFAEKNNLELRKLATPYHVQNADGTPNAAGTIKHFVLAQVEIGDHRSSHFLFVTQLGSKSMIIGYSYLTKHNPQIDWAAGEWEYTRCPTSCFISRAHKITDMEAGSDELPSNPWDLPLDEIGEIDPHNHFISLVDLDDPDDYVMAQQIASLTDKDGLDESEPDEDTRNWKQHVPDWLHDYGDVFSKTKSERMPTHKPYDHPIDFIPGKDLPKPSKVYPLTPK